MAKTVHDIMTNKPAFCTPDTSLQEVARMMVQNDCGCIPVVEARETMIPMGTVTDRDIVIGTVAEGKNPLQLKAKDCMSTPVVTITQDSNLKNCCKIMEDHQVRRLVVVDENGRCCGMVSQADIARTGEDKKIAEVLEEVSKPAHEHVTSAS
jgi:CBS domain-containing protein